MCPIFSPYVVPSKIFDVKPVKIDNSNKQFFDSTVVLFKSFYRGVGFRVLEGIGTYTAYYISYIMETNHNNFSVHIYITSKKVLFYKDLESLNKG
jgi:hypothetical protein